MAAPQQAYVKGLPKCHIQKKFAPLRGEENMTTQRLPAGIHWTSQTEYYDIETGLQITKHTFHKHYIKIKTTKHVRLNEHKTHRVISYTIECRRNPQTKLFQTN